MFRILFFLALLGGAVLLIQGGSTNEKKTRGDCELRPVELGTKLVLLQSIVEKSIFLKRNAKDIYGFFNRLNQNAIDTGYVLEDVKDYLFGTRSEGSKISDAYRARIHADLDEFNLLYDVAKFLDFPACVIEPLIPDRKTDSYNSAMSKLLALDIAIAKKRRELWGD